MRPKQIYNGLMSGMGGKAMFRVAKLKHFRRNVWVSTRALAQGRHGLHTSPKLEHLTTTLSPFGPAFSRPWKMHLGLATRTALLKQHGKLHSVVMRRSASTQQVLMPQ